jgi:hypothetical protein
MGFESPSPQTFLFNLIEFGRQNPKYGSECTIRTIFLNVHSEILGYYTNAANATSKVRTSMFSNLQLQYQEPEQAMLPTHI